MTLTCAHCKLTIKDNSTPGWVQTCNCRFPDPEQFQTGYAAKSSNMVSHPSHYNSGKIEVIEALEDWGLNFHRANAVKYIARAGKKDPSKEVEDLEKAVWYLKRDIEIMKAAKEKREKIRPNDMNKRTYQSDEL